MSKLTKCNYCKFEEIKSEAAQAGMQPWIRDKDGGVEAMVGSSVVAWFTELSESCRC